MCSIFHVLTRCIKCTKDQETHFNYTDVLLWLCCNQQVQGYFFKNRHILFIHSSLGHVQNATIPCRSQELLPFLSVMYFFPATFPYRIFVHPLSPHLAIYFLVYLSILLFPNSNIILFWEQTHIILFIKLLKKSYYYILLLRVHSNKTGMPCLKKKKTIIIIVFLFSKKSN